MSQARAAYGLGVFFVIAGLNHFRDPGFYLPLIPDYLPFPGALNVLSGVLEVLLGAAVFARRSRRLGALGILALLILFVSSHVHFIQIGSCASGSLCVPPWIAWVRLIVIHPLLMAWAYMVSRPEHDARIPA